MVSFKKMLDEDEHHRASQRKGKCDKTVARRLYIRDYYINSSRLAVRQSFIPIGVICLTCAFTMGSPLAALGYINNRARLVQIRDEMHSYDQALEQTLEQAHESEDFDQILNEKYLNIKNDIEKAKAKVPRAQKRRSQRSEEKIAKLQNKYNIKKKSKISRGN